MNAPFPSVDEKDNNVPSLSQGEGQDEGNILKGRINENQKRNQI